jgi:hypothetical protein
MLFNLTALAKLGSSFNNCNIIMLKHRLDFYQPESQVDPWTNHFCGFGNLVLPEMLGLSLHEQKGAMR